MLTPAQFSIVLVLTSMLEIHLNWNRVKKTKKKIVRRKAISPRKIHYIAVFIGGVVIAVLLTLFPSNNSTTVLGIGKPTATTPIPSPTPTGINTPVATPLPSGSSAPNIVPNHSFETDTDNNKIPDGWTYEGESDLTRTGDGIDCTQASVGSCSFKIFPSSKRQQSIRTIAPFPLITARHVRLTIDSKSYQAPRGYMIVYLKNTSTGSLHRYDLTIPEGTNSDFVTTIKTFYNAQLITVNEASVQLTYVMNKRGAPVNGSISFDNVKIELFE